MEEFIHSYGLNATNEDTQKKKIRFHRFRNIVKVCSFS